MDLVFPHAGIRGQKYYPGGDKRLPNGRHPRTGLRLDLGLHFLFPRQRGSREASIGKNLGTSSHPQVWVERRSSIPAQYF